MDPLVTLIDPETKMKQKKARRNSDLWTFPISALRPLCADKKKVK